MTQEEMVVLITEKNLLGRLKGLLLKEFPSDTQDVEDWAQRAFIRALKNADAFYDESGVVGYAREAAIGLAMNDKEKEIARQAILKGRPRYKQAHDPMRHTDYKIDLERAIKRTVHDHTLQAALWEIHYDKSTWDEVLADMPPTKKAEGWHSALQRANAALKQEMRRKGYGRRKA